MCCEEFVDCVCARACVRARARVRAHTRARRLVHARARARARARASISLRVRRDAFRTARDAGRDVAVISPSRRRISLCRHVAVTSPRFHFSSCIHTCDNLLFFHVMASKCCFNSFFISAAIFSSSSVVFGSLCFAVLATHHGERRHSLSHVGALFDWQ